MPNLTDVLEDEDRSTVEGIVNDMTIDLGDMYKSTYDTNNNGTVDDAELVNGKEVLSNVPVINFNAIAFTDVNNTYTVAQSGDREVATYAATTTFDFSASNRFQVTLTGNVVIGLPDSISENQGGVIYIIQGVGSSTVDWDPVFKPMNLDDAPGTVGDIQIYSYEVYSASRIILTYVGII